MNLLTFTRGLGLFSFTSLYSIFNHLIDNLHGAKEAKLVMMTKPNVSSPDQTVSFTLRKAPYSYFHLSLRPLIATSQAPHDLDEISARAYLTLALQQYLGLTGTAVSIDILKVEARDVWIRVPSEDEVAVTASLSQWAGSKDLTWRIQQRGTWLGALVGNTHDQKLWTLES